ncbi:Chemotaxis response regulator protein-glutamate methylesterase CheB [gamma proteobacterium IMCC2047]|nr:Chemotaxis response regulator protein-glutamate methylesterase CheB [gamma proteobacterium IMCC2047]
MRAAGRVKLSALKQRLAGKTSVKKAPQNTPPTASVSSSSSSSSSKAVKPSTVAENARRIIAIGSSTGGTVAVGTVLSNLPTSTAGIVIAQHIPEAFSASFADRLDKTCQLTVEEAKDGQVIRNGYAYIAPGRCHLKVKKDGLYYVCQLEDSPPVNKHRPSVDVLFDSVAAEVGRHALGIILTGMGRDGADGLQRMKAAGAATVAQDEKSSVVWGMPGEAVKLGGVDEVLPLNNIADKIIDYTEQQKR